MTCDRINKRITCEEHSYPFNEAETDCDQTVKCEG